MKTIVMLTAILMLGAVASDAQRHGHRHNVNPAREYNTTTVTTVQGTIKSIEHPASRNGRFAGTHLTLATASGTFDVHLGPSWYLDQKELALNSGDMIEVTGSKIKQAGTVVIIAKSVTKNNNTLQLRNDDGTPLWSGARRQ